MVIGSVVPRRDVESSETVRKYLFERFARAPFPVAMGLAAGHLPQPRTLALGVPVRAGPGRIAAALFHRTGRSMSVPGPPQTDRDATSYGIS